METKPKKVFSKTILKGWKMAEEDEAYVDYLLSKKKKEKLPGGQSLTAFLPGQPNW